MTLIETGNGAGKAGVTFMESRRWNWKYLGWAEAPWTLAWCDCGWAQGFAGTEAGMAGRAVQAHWGQAHR